MSDKKLTDSEIVKAVECCIKSVTYNECEKCPYYDDENEALVCTGNLLTNALDLINRLQEQLATNERLSNFVTEERCIEIAREMIPAFVRQAKAEAYKEFAERLRSIIMWSPKNHISITAKDVEMILKELVGDSGETVL